jgi:hypothetical protein
MPSFEKLKLMIFKQNKVEMKGITIVIIKNWTPKKIWGGGKEDIKLETWVRRSPSELSCNNNPKNKSLELVPLKMI